MMNKTSLLLLALACPAVLHADEQTKSLAKIVAIQSAQAPKPIGPFSQAIKASNVSEVLYISGQLPIDPATDELKKDPAQATEQCMKNLAAILHAAGIDFKSVVETTILLADIKDFPVVNKVYESFLTSPYPARATFQAGALPKGACVEIKMTAVK